MKCWTQKKEMRKYFIERSVGWFKDEQYNQSVGTIFVSYDVMASYFKTHYSFNNLINHLSCVSYKHTPQIESFFITFNKWQLFNATM